MEANQSKLSLSLILLLSSSWVMAGFSQELGGNRPNVPMDCLEKLLPCESYLKPPASPPSSCCVPLKQMIKDDPNCLCSIFNDVNLLKSLNVSQSDLLELPKACSANVDISVCSKAAPATASNGSSTSKSTNTLTSRSSAFGIYLSDGCDFLAIFTSLVLSAF